MVTLWPASSKEVVEFSLIAFSSIFFIVDPIACIPTFLVLTVDHPAERRRLMARSAAWTCFLVMMLFATGGSVIFHLFGITLPALKIAGGILLFAIAWDMLQARRSSTQEGEVEREEASHQEDVGVIPLGVPMLAGPGSLSTVMVLMGQAHQWWQVGVVVLSVAVTCVASYLTLAAADRVRGKLHETGIRIAMRLMGLVLAAIAVQFVLNGLNDVGLLKVTR